MTTTVLTHDAFRQERQPVLAPALNVVYPTLAKVLGRSQHRPFPVHHECVVRMWGLDLLPDRMSVDPLNGAVGHVLVPARLMGQECAICLQRLDRCPWGLIRIHEMCWHLPAVSRSSV